MFEVTAKFEFSDQQISDLLCTAFEGGSNYWYMIEEKIPPKATFDEMTGQMVKSPDCVFVQDYPIDGGALVISEMSGYKHGGKTKWTLDRAALEKGLQVMADKFPSTFHDLVNENADADTGDCFLQCCLFGDLIFS